MIIDGAGEFDQDVLVMSNNFKNSINNFLNHIMEIDVLWS